MAPNNNMQSIDPWQHSKLWPAHLRTTLLMMFMMDLTASFFFSLTPEVRLDFCFLSSSLHFSSLASSPKGNNFQRVFLQIVFLNVSFLRMMFVPCFTLFRSIFLDRKLCSFRLSQIHLDSVSAAVLSVVSVQSLDSIIWMNCFNVEAVSIFVILVCFGCLCSKYCC